MLGNGGGAGGRRDGDADNDWRFPDFSTMQGHLDDGYGADAFQSCAGPLTRGFRPHGLNLRPGLGGRHTLYVVRHGAREAIEVFALDAARDHTSTPPSSRYGTAQRRITYGPGADVLPVFNHDASEMMWTNTARRCCVDW